MIAQLSELNILKSIELCTLNRWIEWNVNSILEADGYQQMADGQSCDKMKTFGVNFWLRVLCGSPPPPPRPFVGSGRAAQSTPGNLTGV